MTYAAVHATPRQGAHVEGAWIAARAAPVLQRCGAAPPETCPCHAEERGEHTTAPPIVHDVLNSPGEPLDTTSRAELEARFGHDFGRVRVHRDTLAAESARAIGAQAYTLGTHIVLAAGQPAARVLAHELTHVVQQGFSSAVPAGLEVGGHTELEDQADAVADRVVRGGIAGVSHGAFGAHALVQRQQPRAGTAAAAPHLDVQPSTNGAPCACLVFIHNDERNARLTAELMHRHCSYNLAIISPENRRRRIQLPRHGGDVDPNELFPRAVAEQCSANPQACREFLARNAGSTDPAVIEGFAQRQFYLAVHDCSNEFALPVVALHNNAINDTADYRRRQAAVNAADLRRGVFERTPPAQAAGARQPQANPARPLQELQDWLAQHYGQQTATRLTGAKGTTNIFRWCVSPDIGRCHVGDPEHPDTTVWVTNEADFERLSAQNVNVVLQTGISATGESAKDLSSLFLVLREVLQARHAPVIAQLEQGLDVEVKRIRELIQELRQLFEFHDETLSNTLPKLAAILETVVRVLVRLVELAAVEGSLTVRLERLRYVNVETPISPTSGQTDAQLREESYASIAGVLRAVGLHCCGDDAEGRVRAGLRRGALEEPAAH